MQAAYKYLDSIIGVEQYMINIDNGDIVLENLQYILSHKTQIIDFENNYPKEFIRNISKLENGYTWFYIWGRIVKSDSVILISLCFDPKDEIQSVNIYPHVNFTTKLEWSDWTEKNLIMEKMICDKWLSENFNLDETNKYNWGSINSLSDVRSGNSFIMLKYTSV